MFQLSATAQGRAGTACAGLTFTVTAVPGSTTGQVQFTPSNPIVLAPPGGPNTACTIDFTFDVLKSPTKTVGGQPAGTTAQIATATATSSVTGSPGGGFGVGLTQVAPVVGAPLVSPVLGAIAGTAALMVGGLFVVRRHRRLAAAG